MEADTFIYTAVADSTGPKYDVITGVKFDNDRFDVHQAGGSVVGVDSAVTAGTLSTAGFDTNLAAAVGAGQMAAHTALLFTPNAGTLSGHTFLIVDENGTAGYQAGADLVIDVTGATGTLITGHFGWSSRPRRHRCHGPRPRAMKQKTLSSPGATCPPEKALRQSAHGRVVRFPVSRPPSACNSGCGRSMGSIGELSWISRAHPAMTSSQARRATICSRCSRAGTTRSRA
ncbi:MAG: bluetail domain-containing putative surface protein [Rhizomicrobium sp.]